MKEGIETAIDFVLTYQVTIEISAVAIGFSIFLLGAVLSKGQPGKLVWHIFIILLIIAASLYFPSDYISTLKQSDAEQAEINQVLLIGISDRWQLIKCLIEFILVAISIYALKCRAQVLYGFFELYISLWGFCIYISTGVHDRNATAKLLTLWGSLYVFVRGLNNIGDGWNKDGSISRVWNRVFKGKSLPSANSQDG